MIQALDIIGAYNLMKISKKTKLEHSLICSLSLFFRHVHPDMFITFTWIGKIRSECVIRPAATLPMSARTNRAWNQVEYRSVAE